MMKEKRQTGNFCEHFNIKSERNTQIIYKVKDRSIDTDLRIHDSDHFSLGDRWMSFGKTLDYIYACLCVDVI